MSIWSKSTGKQPDSKPESQSPVPKEKLWNVLNSVLAEPAFLADRIVVFADFQNSDHSELPVFAYGIHLYDETCERITYVFESSGEGCLMSEIADERRSASINAVIFYLNNILISTCKAHRKPYKVTVRAGMKINGIILPKNFILA